MVDHKSETLESMMPRKRPNWPGPGPETCAICEIIMWNVFRSYVGRSSYLQGGLMFYCNDSYPISDFGVAVV